MKHKLLGGTLILLALGCTVARANPIDQISTPTNDFGYGQEGSAIQASFNQPIFSADFGVPYVDLTPTVPGSNTYTSVSRNGLPLPEDTITTAIDMPIKSNIVAVPIVVTVPEAASTGLMLAGALGALVGFSQLPRRRARSC